MGREVRRVPGDWQHPKDAEGNYIPLSDSFAEEAKDWDDESAKWERGEFPTYIPDESRKLSFIQWGGARPDPKNYMPDWSESEKTFFMMYETCSDGTPISPAFTTPEALAYWLVATGASAFGSQRGSYEGWLRVARGNSAPSAVYIPDRGLCSGVDAPEEELRIPGGDR